MMRKGLLSSFWCLFISIGLAFSCNASPTDLGQFQAAPHSNILIDIDTSMLSTDMDYTLICILPPQEDEEAIMPYMFGHIRPSFYVNGIKWPPYTKYAVEAHKETKIAFTPIRKGSNIRVGIQNLSALATMIFHCYANPRH